MERASKAALLVSILICFMVLIVNGERSSEKEATSAKEQVYTPQHGRGYGGGPGYVYVYGGPFPYGYYGGGFPYDGGYGRFPYGPGYGRFPYGGYDGFPYSRYGKGPFYDGYGNIKRGDQMDNKINGGSYNVDEKEATLNPFP